jgi:hypothetical protein
MEDLPEACIQQIFSGLSHESLLRVAATCRRLRDLAAGVDSCEGESAGRLPHALHWAMHACYHAPLLAGTPIKTWQAMATVKNSIACGSWRDELMLAARGTESSKRPSNMTFSAMSHARKGGSMEAFTLGLTHT